MDFNVDGREYPDALYSQPNVPKFEVGAELRGKEVYAPITLMAAMLKGTVTPNKAIKVGSKQIRPTNTFTRKGRVMAPVRQTVKDLGGKSWWSNGVLYIRTPQGP
jgi:hypothetical protein